MSLTTLWIVVQNVNCLSVITVAVVICQIAYVIMFIHKQWTDFFVSGVVLCKLNELSSAEQVISSACRDSYTHVSLHLAALDQLADCLAAQVVLCYTVYCYTTN